MSDDLAPPPLQRLLDFVNTRQVDTNADELAEPEQFAAWLAAHDLLTDTADAAGKRPTPTAADHDLALAIREELRIALLANHDQTPESEQQPRGAAIDRITFTVRLNPAGTPELTPAQDGIRGALGRLLQPLPAAAADGSWARAKVCPADTCLWAFYDKSRNRSRRWCSMEVCGNREKSRTFRQRHD